MLQNLLQEIAPKLFFETVLGQSLPPANNRKDVRVNCVFHQHVLGRPDDTGSLSINIATDGAGMWRCFGCDSSGNLITFYQKYREVHGVIINGVLHQGPADLRTISRELIQLFNLDSDTFERALIDDSKIAKYQHDLFHTESGKKLLAHIKSHRCITDKVIRDYKLGMNEAGRLAIPIFDANDDIVNVRYWLPEYLRKTKEDDANKILGIGGANKPRLYPYAQLRNQDLIICEGELDALVLIGMGFNAITTTGGVEGFASHWTRFFEGKDVCLMLDNDAAGLRVTDEMLIKLYPVVKTIKQIAPGTLGMDITDWCRSNGASAIGVYREVIKNTPFFWIQDEERKDYDVTNLHSAASAVKINKKIALEALVHGKDEQIYAIPKLVQLTCTSDKPKNCPGCPRLMFDRDTRELTIEPDSPTVVEILESKNVEVALKKLFNVSCKYPHFTILSYQNVEVLNLIPAVARNTTEAYEYTNRLAYFVSDSAKLKANYKYKFRGRTVLDGLFRVTHVFNDADIQDKLPKNLKPEDIVCCDGAEGSVKHFLTTFKVENNQEVIEKLHDIYTDLEKHVTHIIQRRDVLQAIDLVYHSPLSFMFGDRVVERGWMSCLVIGDTQCGKSETLYNLQKHFMLGECYSGENITRAGIIGAFVAVPGRRDSIFRLGVAPLNDGGLLGIDEAGGMDETQFGELTMLRSTGMAMSTKMGQHWQVPARVRMVMLANPKGGKPMRLHSFGCQAIKDLVGGDADVARFDIFVAVGSDEVRIDEINQAPKIIGDPVYTSDLSNLLLQWVWSRRASDYIFTEDARNLVMSTANEMSEQYDQAIPLVAHGSQRWTIARVAASIASRLYSTEDGQHVIVQPCHVEAAASFLYETYNKPTMGYSAFSARQKTEETLVNPEAVKRICDMMPYQLFDNIATGFSRFTVRELESALGLGEFSIKEFVSQLHSLRAIKHSGGYFYRTGGFKTWLDSSKYVHPEKETYLNDLLTTLESPNEIN
jgi:hypothetical protein